MTTLHVAAFCNFYDCKSVLRLGETMLQLKALRNNYYYETKGEKKKKKVEALFI